MKVSEKIVGRLSLYRRLLHTLQADGVEYVYSHQLANVAGVTAAQVRRDIMEVGYNGSTAKGYSVEKLAESIGKFLDVSETMGVVLVGFGNLGRALLSYFSTRHTNLAIVGAFDVNPELSNRVIHGCRCYSIDELQSVTAEKRAQVGMIAVPADQAQSVADALVKAGIRGILNFAPTPLRVGPNVYVETMDITTALEKVAYFTRKNLPAKES